MFPQSYITFGILHGMAFMLIVARLLAGRALLVWIGLAALALPWLAPYLHAAWPGADVLNSRALNWLDLVSHKPITEDYAPVFPWLGVMCLGLAAGQWMLRAHPLSVEAASTALNHGAVRNPATLLALMGR